MRNDPRYGGSRTADGGEGTNLRYSLEQTMCVKPLPPTGVYGNPHQVIVQRRALCLFGLFLQC